MSMYQIVKTRYRELTAADVDNMGKRLLATKAMHEREIELAGQVADALAPVAHYKKIDARAAKVVQAVIDDSRVSISRSQPNNNYSIGKEYVTLSVGQGYRLPQAQFTRVVERVEANATVADLIAAFRACEYSRTALERANQQFGRLEEIIDAEERIKGLAEEIEKIRKDTSLALLGTEWNHWHDAVREHLPTLAGER